MVMLSEFQNTSTLYLVPWPYKVLLHVQYLGASSLLDMCLFPIPSKLVVSQDKPRLQQSSKDFDFYQLWLQFLGKCVAFLGVFLGSEIHMITSSVSDIDINISRMTNTLSSISIKTPAPSTCIFTMNSLPIYHSSFIYKLLSSIHQNFLSSNVTQSHSIFSKTLHDAVL